MAVCAKARWKNMPQARTTPLISSLRDTGHARGCRYGLCDALCDYLVAIHDVRGDDPGLCVLRIRELVVDGECIMGLADSYPRHPLFAPRMLQEIE
jgi:hypothetical protein